MSVHKKHLYYIGVTLLFLVFLSSIDFNTTPISDSMDQIKEIDDFNEFDIPSLSDSAIFYQTNWGYTVEELFSSGGDISDWYEGHPSPIFAPGGTIDIFSGSLRLLGDSDGNYDEVSAEYVADPYPFIDGYLWFRYQLVGSQSDYVRLDIYDGSWSINVWEDTTGGSWETHNVSLSSYNTEHSDFTFRFHYRGRDINDYV